MGDLVDIPIFGGLLVALMAGMLLLFSDPFSGTSSAPPSPPPPPKVPAHVAIARCAASFNSHTPAGRPAVPTTAYIAPQAGGGCLVRIDGGLTYALAGGIWRHDVSGSRLTGVPNADVAFGRLTPR